MSSPQRIAVAGGTGVVGVHVVEVARERGHEVVVLSRAVGIDLTAGADVAERLTALLAGVDVVVDVSSTATIARATAERFFVAVTRHLLAAEVAAGVGHHVALSIVGIDDVAFGYYQGKVLQERLVAEGSVPWTVLRATQFHEFAEQMLDRGALGPVIGVPRMLSRPIAAREVAQRLVDLAEAEPAGRVADLAGPREEQMVDLARRVRRHRGVRRPVVGLLLPGAAARQMRRGVLLPVGDSSRGVVTFEDWLASRPRATRA